MKNDTVDKFVNVSVDDLRLLRSMLISDIAFKEKEQRDISKELPLFRRITGASFGSFLWLGVGIIIGCIIFTVIGIITNPALVIMSISIGATLLLSGIFSTFTKDFFWSNYRRKYGFTLRSEISKMRMRLRIINDMLRASGENYTDGDDAAEIEQHIANISATTIP